MWFPGNELTPQHLDLVQNQRSGALDYRFTIERSNQELYEESVSQFAHKKGESLSNTFLNREKRGMISVQPCPINKAVVPPKEIYCFSHCFPTPAGSCIKKNDSHPTKTKIITVPPLNLLKMKFCSPLGWKWLHCVWKLNKRVIVKDDWVTYVRSCLKWIFLSWRNKIQFIMKPTNIDWWRSSKLFFYSKSFRSIKWSRPRRSQSMGLPLSQRDSRFLHEIEASDQPVWDGAQTPKSHSIQKEATRIIYI